MEAKTFVILMVLPIAALIVELIRQQRMTFKYSSWWLFSTLIVLFFAFNDSLLGSIATLFGFALPSNFIFFLLLTFFTALSLMLTIYINEQNIRAETLTQAIALLGTRVKELEKEKKSG